MNRPQPLHAYLFANATWFLAVGIQMVVFSWLITLELQETPTRVGIAQMALLFPTLLFILIGGSLADRYGGRNVSIVAQLSAALGPLGLTVVIVSDNLSFTTIILFALWMGTAQALLTPARDGILSQLADGNVQRLIVQVSMIQFGIQVVGFLLASLVDRIGAGVILCAQSFILMVGAVSFYFLHVGERSTPNANNGFTRDLSASILEGFRTIRANRTLASVTIQNLAMGAFLMGSYIVTLPLLIRESYGGTAAELAWVNSANVIGLFTSSMILFRFGSIRRPGRTLLISLAIAGSLLITTALAGHFGLMLLSIFLWGGSGGLIMTMSRSIMQEQAPADQRARVMAYFSLSFMGAGLIGALLSGYLVEKIHPEGALIVSGVGMLIAVTLVRVFSSLWTFESSWR